MRVYFTTNVETSREIFQSGWRDLHAEFGMRGVYFATTQLDANEGFDGMVTLCLDVPPQVMDEYEVTDEVQRQSGYGLALIPATTLNQIGKPQVYDHFYTGCTRRDLVQSARQWEGAGRHKPAKSIRDAIEFFDSIGWLTPVKLRESGKELGDHE
jgi:hypothetical protein